MWAKSQTRIWVIAAAITLLAAACSDESGPDSEPTTPATTAQTSAPRTTTTTELPPTTVTTVIPTTSVPPSTLPPPELSATTTTTPPVTTTTTGTLDDAVVVTPDDDFATLVDQAAAGTKFIILPGVHRITEAEPKDEMVFEGIDGATLNGSVLLDTWEPIDDGWDTTGPELNMNRHGECVDGYSACALRNDLFIDDQMLWRVDDRGDLESGTWWSDGRRIVIADDPAGRKIEVSVTEHAFRSDADGVTIRGLTIEKFAPIAQTGAIQMRLPGTGSQATNWLVEDVEVRLNHAAGIATGDNTTIRNVHAHHNGQQGITGTQSTGVVIESSEINHNNLRGFAWGWEAGGIKYTRTTDLVFRDLEVHHNLGPGLWADIECADVLYEDNTVYSNSAMGIFHEISYDAVIRNNEVYDNGFIKGEWIWGSGILVAASSNVEVYGNVVTNNADGIGGIQQRRESEGVLYRLENLRVYDNTITMWFGWTGVVQDMDDLTVFTDRNIVFENNTYIGAGYEAFTWGNLPLTWEDWLATGQGAGSTRSDG